MYAFDEFNELKSMDQACTHTGRPVQHKAMGCNYIYINVCMNVDDF